MSAKWWNLKTPSNENDPYEFYIYDQIGRDYWTGEGTAAADFAREFNAVPSGRKISLRINSPGGSIWDGLAIHSTIAKRAGDVTAYVDGVSLSAASFLMLAAGRVVAPENAIIMIHKPWSVSQGNATQMRKDAEVLDTHEKSIAAIYAQKTGKDEKEIADALEAETWFTGAEAKAWGLVDEVTEPAQIQNAFDLTKFNFKNLPARVLGSQTTNNGADKTAQCVPIASPAASFQGEQALSPAAAGSPNQNQGANSMPETTPAPAANTPAAPSPVTLSQESINALAEALRVPQAAAPAATPRVESVENVAQASITKHAPGRDRFNFVRDNWNSLRQSVPLIYNANTLDTALTTHMLADGLIVALQNRLASLRAFTRDFGTDRIKPGAIVQVPIALSGGTAQTNATSFEDTTNFVATVDNVAITPARITVGAMLTAAELNNGFRMAQFAEIKAAEMADKIAALVNAVITTANFTATPVTSAAAAFGSAELKTLWATLKKSVIKNALLDGEYYAQFLPTSMESFNPLAGNTYPGWDGFYLHTNFTGATTNTVGFACAPQAIAVASGLPLASPNRGMTTRAQTIEIPGLGLSVEQQEWYSTSSKTDWMNWEVMFGAAKADGTAGVLVLSA